MFASVNNGPTVAAANNGPTNPIGVAVAYNNHIVMVVVNSPEQSDKNNQNLDINKNDITDPIQQFTGPAPGFLLNRIIQSCILQLLLTLLGLYCFSSNGNNGISASNSNMDNNGADNSRQQLNGRSSRLASGVSDSPAIDTVNATGTPSDNIVTTNNSLVSGNNVVVTAGVTNNGLLLLVPPMTLMYP